jgi:hypothetical protein
MGDRVEERREEQRILDARLEKNRVDLKRQDETKAFSNVVANMQKTGKETANQTGNRQKQVAQASTRLMARRGIDNNDYSQRLLGDSGSRNATTRRQRVDKDGEMSEQGAARKQATDTQNAERAGRGAVTREQNPKQHKDTNSKKETSREANESRREQVLAGATGAATLQALLGVSPKQSSSGAGAVHANVQKMLDEIVSKVHTGLAGSDKPVIHIELKESVLSGSSLTIQRENGGVSLKIQSPNDEVSRLFSSGQTANELAQSLKRGGVNLTSFEVNNVRVFG